MMKINLPLQNIIELRQLIYMIHANPPRESRTNKQIIIIVCIYIILTVSNRFSANNNQSDEALITKIQNKVQIKMTTVLNEIDKQKFEGQWQKKTKNDSPLFEKQNGKFELFLVRYTEDEIEKFSLDVRIKNGDYIDDGEMSFKVPELITNWTISPSESKLTAALNLNQSQIKVKFIKQQIFQTLIHGQFNLTSLQIVYTVNDKSLTKQLFLQTDNEEIVFNLKRQKYNMSGTILFALILFLIAYSQFSACLDIIKKFIDGEENPINYSFLTLVMTMMWDAALCLTAFIEAFKNEENIVLFIVPALILCLLFTNLELRIMIVVYQTLSGQNDIRHVICRFNLISYGAILAMYPIIVLTNVGTCLFLSFSLLFLPQIYTNAVTGRRPNMNSMYYNQFLLFRFLIVLYLKCFPYNIFELKPNYLLGFGCLLIVGCQLGLLWVQKIYGPKKVLPKFLLPPVYDYAYEMSTDAQSTGENVLQQCSICLEGLNKSPQVEPGIQVVPKLMKTPCGHNYHGVCLVQWMKLKMECPQCRAKLPAFQ